jgi:DNA-binding GntR family transcriptional regulator
VSTVVTKVDSCLASNEDYVAHLRDAITSGRFMPNERLVEKDLVQLLRTNRVYVRTALARLEQEGLVIRERNRGARVRLLSAHEAIENIETRAVLEGLTARHAALNVTPEDITLLHGIMAELAGCYESGDLFRYSAINVRLHQAIIDISKHTLASKLIAMLKFQSVTFQFRGIFEPGRAEASTQEHAAIIAALEAKDPMRAEEAMRTHLNHAVEGLRKVVSREQWRASHAPVIL